jgi:hypothetical protein
MKIVFDNVAIKDVPVGQGTQGLQVEVTLGTTLLTTEV